MNYKTPQNIADDYNTINKKRGGVPVKKNNFISSKSNQELITIIDNSNEGILALDNNNLVLYLNKKLKKFLRLKESSFIDKNFVELFEQNFAEKLLNKITRLKETEIKNINFRHTLTIKNKIINLSINIKKLKNIDNEIFFVLYFLNITKALKTKKELLQTKKAVENANKLKFLFLTQMSHEIRTPINVIVSFSNLLKNDLKDLVNDDLSTAFDIIDKASNRIIRTIDLLLNFAEIQTHSYECIFKEIDLNNILSIVSKEYTRIAEKKGLTLKYTNNVANAKIMVDEYSIIKIFTHLIENAIKYTNKGNITISLNNSTDGKIVAKIQDTGIGISKKYLPKIFNSFSQEEQGYTRKYDGNGIGLTLVKEYCKLNNIQIKVNSKKDLGTTFTLFF